MVELNILNEERANKEYWIKQTILLKYDQQIKRP